MSLIIFLFILAVIVTIFSFIGHIRFPFKSEEEPQSVPPIFPSEISTPPVVEQIPPVIEPVPVVEICPVPTEVESAPVEVELFPMSQSQLEACLSSETTYPTLDAVVADEFKTDETQAPKKKHYYYKPKSKK